MTNGGETQGQSQEVMEPSLGWPGDIQEDLRESPGRGVPACTRSTCPFRGSERRWKQIRNSLTETSQGSGFSFQVNLESPFNPVMSRRHEGSCR